MAAWKKLIYSGSDAELNNLDVLKASGSFSGSFQGEILGTMDSASVAVTAQTASVALRANALAPTVTATSASTAILAQTASVAIRSNTLAPTATASFADSATTASYTAGTASIANTATSASYAVLAGAIRSGLTASHADTATSASISLLASTLSSTATASIADRATSASRAATGDGIFSGSFSGSYQGDGSDLTGIATTLTVDGDSGTSPVSLTDDDLQILGTTNEIVTAITKVGTDVKATISLPDDVTIGNDITITRDALVQRNLTVRGTASFEATADLNIADRFIGLASGSAATGDGGINIQQGANGRGEGFGFENSVSRWGVTSSFDPLGNTITPDAFMTVNVSDGSANDPTAIAARYQKNGNIFIGNTGDIWIYS
tara:strand:- start:501 stop:1637 length:1137 start_codon:yes stop_codon:yes gene_type:complete